MISVSEASKIILSNNLNLGSESVSLMNSFGRILAENIVADQDFPPFDRVCMDGIAVDYDSFLSGKREFFIEDVQAAGSPQKSLIKTENCLEVMTGAMLPIGSNVVIPYEQVVLENGLAKVQIDSVKELQNVHLKGKDKSKNDLLISKGQSITAAEIGVLATVGKVNVSVVSQPKVLIVSTGDELVEVSETPLAHQIRRSNVYSLQALLLDLGISSDTKHLSDDKDSLLKEIQGYLNNYDVLLFSGAVSKGKFDYIPEVLDELGVSKLFHRVKQRPGKPFWFGRRTSSISEPNTNEEILNETLVFAFPGNPVSTFVNCLKYFYPWYQKSVLGKELQTVKAQLSVDFSFKPNMTYFLQVNLRSENAVLMATPVTGNGSGDLANLANADAILELPSERIEFKKGEVFPVIVYR